MGDFIFGEQNGYFFVKLGEQISSEQITREQIFGKQISADQISGFHL